MSGYYISGVPDASGPVVYWFGEDLDFTLREICAKEGFEDFGPLGWGSPSIGSHVLARLMLFHATWDRALVEDMAELFAQEVINRLPARWELHRDTVLAWCREHDHYRDMMHQARGMRNCPGCG